VSASQEIIERYSKVEHADDTFGRVIGVRRLRVSQQIKISEMTPSLEGTVDQVGPDGKIVSMPRRMMPALAAAVCEIDGDKIPFPKSRGELDAVMDRLDIEGLMAAFEASIKLSGGDVPAEEGEDNQKK